MTQARSTARIQARPRALAPYGLGFGLALALAAFAIDADASPKGYDIERLMRQEMPGWRSGRYQAAPQPQPRPLERIPTVPAPAFAPPAESPAPAPAAATPIPPPPPLAPAAKPMMRDAPASAGTGAVSTGTPSGRVIQAPGAPRSTVSGAWAR